jgi:hypothetical protein
MAEGASAAAIMARQPAVTTPLTELIFLFSPLTPNRHFGGRRNQFASGVILARIPLVAPEQEGLTNHPVPTNRAAIDDRVRV